MGVLVDGNGNETDIQGKLVMETETFLRRAWEEMRGIELNKSFEEKMGMNRGHGY